MRYPFPVVLVVLNHSTTDLSSIDNVGVGLFLLIVMMNWCAMPQSPVSTVPAQHTQDHDGQASIMSVRSPLAAVALQLLSKRMPEVASVKEHLGKPKENAARHRTCHKMIIKGRKALRSSFESVS